MPWPFREKITGRRSETTGLHGLRKQVTKANEGPLEKESKGTHFKKEGVKAWACSRKRESTLTGLFAIRVFICSVKAGILGEFSRGDLNRILISLPGLFL